MDRQLPRSVLQYHLKIKNFNKKMQKRGQFQMEEYVIFLRQYFRDRNITFYEAKSIQNKIKELRLLFDVVDGDGDDDRLSKIEEIYFFESLGTSKFDQMGSYQPKMYNYLDPDMKNETLNSLVEDVRYIFPLIPANMILYCAGSFVNY